ncbi:2Fe-2S iron-sulfur cluster-binding protein [Trinickia fusca]|uniref:(2Fe-2S)-binding protein n=1 Tax=Trinickia fusca TaxID=2419777 RepID=A0A494WZ78_9BURK|nr:2Fe-2S iron-sulfur cluster-binding protein [Trinickia fusca]RKP43838.1 (2Fe-2S)-binding protein [Trinickia fusca]
MALEHEPDRTERVSVTVDGKTLDLPAYTTVTAALVVANGLCGTRTSVSGEPRTALCGMGICQECRVCIDGRMHVLACQTICRDGMTIDTDTERAR